MKYIGHKDILYQDNTSPIKLGANGERSSTKRTRHLDTRYPLVVGKLRSGDVTTIEYCPTDGMLGDVLTKPLQGSKFVKFRNAIMGCTDAEYLEYKLKFEESRNCKMHT